MCDNFLTDNITVDKSSYDRYERMIKVHFYNYFNSEKNSIQRGSILPFFISQHFINYSKINKKLWKSINQQKLVNKINKK